MASLPYLLHLADNALILGHRNSEWCGHGPVLEQDIAITNISLDLIGQARNLYQLAAPLAGPEATEDSLAFLRDGREFRNCLLVELPKGNWAVTVLRQFFFQQLSILTLRATAAIFFRSTCCGCRKSGKGSCLPPALEQRMGNTPGRWHRRKS